MSNKRNAGTSKIKKHADIISVLSQDELVIISKALKKYRNSKINIVDTLGDDISENKKLELYYKIAEISMIIDKIS